VCRRSSLVVAIISDGIFFFLALLFVTPPPYPSSKRSELRDDKGSFRDVRCGLGAFVSTLHPPFPPTFFPSLQTVSITLEANDSALGPFCLCIPYFAPIGVRSDYDQVLFNGIPFAVTFHQLFEPRLAMPSMEHEGGRL